MNQGAEEVDKSSSEVSSQKKSYISIPKKQKIEIHAESNENPGISKGAGSKTSRFGYNPGELIPLCVETDEAYLSEFQCLLRKQICFFEVSELDLQCSAQGRHKPISMGQVGIVCRHCAVLPPGLRQAASVYFPTKFEGIYLASQNLSTNHLMIRCGQIPEEIRSQLHQLKGKKVTTPDGGRKYWVKEVRTNGIVQTEKSLRLSKAATL